MEGYDLRLKKDHHVERGGLANADERMDYRCLAKRFNGMTTIHPVGETGSYSPTFNSVLTLKVTVKEKSSKLTNF